MTEWGAEPHIDTTFANPRRDALPYTRAVAVGVGNAALCAQEKRHRLDVIRLWEHIHGLHPRQLVAGCG